MSGSIKGMTCVAAVLVCAVAAAQPLDDLSRRLDSPPLTDRPAENFSARVIVSHETVRPGESFHVAVEMTLAKGVWLYGPAPGPTPLPLKLAPGESELRVGQALFAPTTTHLTPTGMGTELNHVYEGKGHAFLPVTAPAGLKPGLHELPVKITGQVCHESGLCEMVGRDLTATVTIAAATTPGPDWTDRLSQVLSQSKTAEQWAAVLAAGAPAGASVRQAARPPGADLTVAAGVGLALLAGLILNIMPCVLPVIPLRLLSLLGQAGGSRRRFVTLGLAFALGIVLFFAAIAALNVALRLAVEYKLQWGDPFRYPAFVIAMALLLVVLAANMFGVFTVAVPGGVAAIEAGRGVLGAVGMGFLMAILATPCSFAILATAFGWAQFQPLWLGTVGILLIGVGMAAPHAVLAAFPGIVSRIPRAGRWSELFRQFVGFVFLLIAAWLVGTQMKEAYPAWVLAYAVVLATCVWIWGTWVGHDAPAGKKWAVRGAAVAIAAGAGLWMLSPPRPLAVAMRPFDAGEIARVRAEGKPVLVKFTASWCLKCKLLDAQIYNDPEVAAALAGRGVVAFEGDVTRSDLPANDMLYGQLAQSGPPVAAIFARGRAEPILLVGSFSREELLAAVDAARAGS